MIEPFFRRFTAFRKFGKFGVLTPLMVLVAVHFHVHVRPGPKLLQIVAFSNSDLSTIRNIAVL